MGQFTLYIELLNEITKFTYTHVLNYSCLCEKNHILGSCKGITYQEGDHLPRSFEKAVAMVALSCCVGLSAASSMGAYILFFMSGIRCKKYQFPACSLATAGVSRHWHPSAVAASSFSLYAFFI